MFKATALTLALVLVLCGSLWKTARILANGSPLWHRGKSDLSMFQLCLFWTGIIPTLGFLLIVLWFALEELFAPNGFTQGLDYSSRYLAFTAVVLALTSCIAVGERAFRPKYWQITRDKLRANLDENPTAATPELVEPRHRAIYASYVIKYGTWHAAALLGLCGILLGTESPNLPGYIWINLLPLCVFFRIVVTTWPTKERFDAALARLD